MVPSRATLLFVVSLVPAVSFAQSNQSPSLVLPPVIVTVQKTAEDARAVPASVTPVTADTIRDSRPSAITDAALFAPNTFFTESTTRKVSSARFRGIGSTSGDPAITTYLDGVPQLKSGSSNIELLDVSQIEFVRGPQSPLFGRNTLGGIVNVTSARPSLSKWTGTVMAPFGNAGAVEVRGNISGPLTEKTAVSFAGGKQRRDGFTRNATTNNKLDSRDAAFAKAQLMMLPNPNWEARVIYAYERDRDGDNAMGDLSAIRTAPFHLTRDFEGYANRDINNLTVNLKGTGQTFALESTTGFVKWKADDKTDLDFSSMPLATRLSIEEDRQFTQEFRLSSPENAPFPIGSMMLTWHAGLAYFNQGHDLDTVNSFSAFVLSPQISFPVAMEIPEGSIDSNGIGLYGRATLAVNEKTDVTAGLRFDHESIDAHLNTRSTPAVPPTSTVADRNSFSDVSPEIAVGYHVTPEHMAYASFSRGYKAGGFNGAAIAGNESYGEEHAQQLEIGLKSTWAAGRVNVNGAFFQIGWDDLQLNVPNPLMPAQFYILNAGGAGSRGVELEVTARPRSNLDVFATWGYSNALFKDGTLVGGVDLSHNEVPYTPAFTASFGGQLSRPLTAAINGYARAEYVVTGEFQYDEANTQSQNAYALLNLRAGARRKQLFGELWVRNAFDSHYVPIAFAHPGFTPSGFIGENGRPRTFGISIGATF